MHPAGLTGIRIVLKKYLPSDWRSEDLFRARASPADASYTVSVGIAERDAWMLCMNGALEAVVADRELREQQQIEAMDWMRNTGADPAPRRFRLEKSLKDKSEVSSDMHIWVDAMPPGGNQGDSLPCR